MRTIAKKLALGSIKLYQYTVSPALASLGIHCRHTPSCSHYSIDAITQHGLWKGSWLMLARLLRCHPFGSSGFDPIPQNLAHYPLWQAWKYGDWRWTKRSYNEQDNTH